jgi:predicted outer membrane lipoprotein
MNERRTLSLLGWIMGSLLGAFFVLNAIALSDTATADVPALYTD